MSAFNGLTLTTAGQNLLLKAQTGTQIKVTKVSVGDGALAQGQQAKALTKIINEIKVLQIIKLKVLATNKADIGVVLSNQDITTGFYFREIGVYALDPDIGEILYCYGNAGSTAEYIPPKGGADVIEKSIDLFLMVGDATNVTATIDNSAVYATVVDLSKKIDKIPGMQLSTNDYTTLEKQRLGVLKNITVNAAAPGSPVNGDIWYKVL